MHALSANLYHKDIHSYLERRISFSFLERIPSGEGKAIEQSQDFFLFLDKALSNESFVTENIMTYRFLKTYISDKIINASWAVKDKIYESIVSEDRFDMTKEMTVNFINFLLILRDIIASYNTFELIMFDEYRYERTSFLKKSKDALPMVSEEISIMMPKISPMLFHIASKIFLPYRPSDDFVPFIVRLVALFSYMARMLSYSQYTESIKGSLDANESIINSIFYNADFFGLDRSLVREISTFLPVL